MMKIDSYNDDNIVIGDQNIHITCWLFAQFPATVDMLFACTIEM